jgi:hypothetical protein
MAKNSSRHIFVDRCRIHREFRRVLTKRVAKRMEIPEP